MRELDEIYPSDAFLAPRAAESVSKWMPHDLHSIEAMTGNLLSICGALRVLAHKSVASPLGLKLMRETGIGHGSDIITYDDKDDYEAKIAAMMSNRLRAAFIYSLEDGALDAQSIIANSVLQHLNNKTNIASLAGLDNTPKQRLITLSNGAYSEQLKAPIVLKVPTDDPNAGGLDVYVCRKPRHVARGLKRLSGSHQLIAEEYIEAKENWCVQFSVSADGQVEYLGASQQICMANGTHGGNLIETDHPLPENALSVAKQAVKNGAQMGFIGLCGVDVLVDRQGKAFAIDLNFRPVSSAAFLYAGQKANKANPKVRRLAFCQYTGTFDALVKQCDFAFQEGWLTTLATYDPLWGGIGNGDARIRLSIDAEDQRHLIEREAQLTRAGLRFLPFKENAKGKASALGRVLRFVLKGRSVV